MSSHQHIAVITGASSGLGALFAEELSRQSDVAQLWLIARREERLLELKEQIESNTLVRVRVFAVDLLQSVSALRAAFLEEAPEVRYWINNAGLGVAGRFEHLTDWARTQVVEVNCRALVEMDAVVLPYLVRGARVLHTASAAAFLPQPGFSVYAASKAFVLSYSRALGAELRARGIYVTAVCPGPMETDFFRYSQEGSVRGIKKIGLEDPKKVVKKALRQARRGKSIAISSWSVWGLRLISRILPHPLVLWLEKKMRVF